MPDFLWFLVAGVFTLGGTVKGIIGLGLPAIVMGLLALVMTTGEAAAILVLPGLILNMWQMLAGPHLLSLARRLWPLILCIAGGTLSGAGWLTGANARLGTAVLGVTLVVYALIGLRSPRFSVRAAARRWADPLVGVVTGLIGAATSVFVIPLVPYLHATGLEKDELVQALGLMFAVSMVALGVNLYLASALHWSLGPAAAVALASAAAGQWFGQSVRRKLRPDVFRTCFFIGLLLLGIYLFARSIA
ncbi:MAG: sulfite exporter TauE/SafE family protein [Acidimicrobiia bacterium]|nr:sulfite exporter TauE/SafE family protein [Acidimicrobiia bacterium]